MGAGGDGREEGFEIFFCCCDGGRTEEEGWWFFVVFDERNIRKMEFVEGFGEVGEDVGEGVGIFENYLIENEGVEVWRVLKGEESSSVVGDGSNFFFTTSWEVNLDRTKGRLVHLKEFFEDFGV